MPSHMSMLSSSDDSSFKDNQLLIQRQRVRYVKRQYKGLSFSLIRRPQGANTKLGHSKGHFANGKKEDSPSYQILM
ncbi:hypothetical protein POTOM_019805 [Populus tomentosa]|uniref:Uncharacterized protein n=1 Tax=Populus tomentosa TaxID=118781 RepID=A0A8X8D587_POPTO|nr:hypothetical protein POTOM_019805 [Populus tomentosa]